MVPQDALLNYLLASQRQKVYNLGEIRFHNLSGPNDCQILFK